MNTVRRGYIYIAAFISLQVVTWALIYLLRNLLSLVRVQSDLAWQLALIVIGLPLFIGHWLWGQRLVRGSEEERHSVLRRLYLYAVAAAFLGPILYQLFSVLSTSFQMAAGVDLRASYLEPIAQGRVVRESLIALLVLLLLGVYHYLILERERKAKIETAGQAVVRRLFQWGFTFAGLLMAVISASEMIQWIIERLSGRAGTQRPSIILPELALLLIGTALWLLFWLWDQRLFAADTGHEQGSVLRKFYLYAVLLIGLMIVVGNLSVLWASLLQTWFGVPVPGELSEYLPLIITWGVAWAFHVRVLAQDARQAPYERQQVTIRQIYQYLIAGVGLLALLIGVGGLLSVLIRTIGGEPLDRTATAYFLAAVTAGLPVWLWPWWQIQGRVRSGGEAGLLESGSLVRRIYLYGFVLVATITILSSGVYLVYRLFLLLFGLSEDASSQTDLALAVAYGLLGLGIWLYHGRLLQGDSRRIEAARAARMGEVKVVVLNQAGSDLGDRLSGAIHSLLPNVTLQAVDLDGVVTEEERPARTAMIETADIIIGSWTMAAGETAAGDEQLQAALTATPAHKVLVPTRQPGWEWAGLAHDEPQAIIQDAARMVEKLAVSESGIQRRWGLGTTIAVAIGAIILLMILVNIIGALSSYLY